MDIRDYLSSPERTLVEIAAAVASLVLEVEGVPLKPSPGHPGLVSLDPLRVSVPARSVTRGSIPRQVWQAAATRSGLSVQRCRQVVALLKLPDEALALIHAHRLSQSALRPILRMTDASQQIAAVGVLTSQATPATDLAPEVAVREPTAPAPPCDWPMSAPAGRAAQPATPRVPHQPPAGPDDLAGLLALLAPIHHGLSHAPPHRRQAWAERLAQDPAATAAFVALEDAAAVLHRLLTAVYAVGDAGDAAPVAALPSLAGVATGRRPRQPDGLPPPLEPEPGDEAGNDLHHLVTYVMSLQRWLISRPNAALLTIVQQLREPQARRAFEVVDQTSSHLYRILAAAIAQPASHHLDGLDAGCDLAETPHVTASPVTTTAQGDHQDGLP